MKKTLYCNIEEIVRIKATSNSRKNFAANLNRKVFSVRHRTNCNIQGKQGKDCLPPEKIEYLGKQGKDCLPPEKIEYLKQIVFRMFPLTGQELEKSAWSACIVAIDEARGWSFFICTRALYQLLVLSKRAFV